MRPLFKRVLSFANQMVTDHCKARVFGPFNGFTVIGSLFSFLVAITCACLFVLPIFEPAIYTSEIPKSSGSDAMRTCNVFQGSWIPEESYPLYNASQCPFAERGFNCLANGRRDRGYTKWRWKPKHCDIPQLDVLEILEYLRDKRVVFVGDSLSRTQWESFICMLMIGVEDKRSVYEIYGNQITKKIRFLSVGFSSYNLRVDFYRSVFLARPGPVPKRAPKRVKSTVILDKMDDISKEWIDSDFLIFNSGHWWTPTKLFEIQGLLFSARWIPKARDANCTSLQNCIKHLGILG